jgi:hypothetical protein
MADKWVPIDRASGSGYVIPRGGVEKTPVGYEIVVHRMMLNGDVPGSLRIEAIIKNLHDDLFTIRNVGKYFTLLLSDGRRLDFFFRDQNGSIANCGPGLYREPPE